MCRIIKEIITYISKGKLKLVENAEIEGTSNM